jgi:type IV pilus assembly protein PilM
MSLWRSITHFVKDPPPEHVFEISEAGIAFAVNGHAGFEELEPGALVASPLEDNLRAPDAVTAALQRIAPMNGGNRRRRPAAVILPDHAVRVSLLDFDSLPASAEEQLALVRFRVKKTIPFDIDSASVHYWVQPGSIGKKKVDVVAVTVAIEILARYEALFRNAGFLPGEVTTAALCSLELYREPGVVIVAKLAKNILTVVALADGRLKLFRCVPVEEATDEEILSVLQPTFAFVEDELGQPAGKLVLCGFGRAPLGVEIPIEVLRSRLGVVNAFNAGLLGYLEAAA